MDLSIFKNIHREDRAFLICCGPSLKETDLSLLQDEIIYAVGLAYKANLPHIDHHFIGDKNIVSQNHHDITLNLGFSGTSVFVSKGIYDSGLIGEFPNIWYFTGHGKKKFHTDITKPIYGGGTATFLAMQFAYYMGIQELYAIGLDHRWDLSTSRKTGKHTIGGDEILKAKGKDINHFSEDYFKNGTIWHTPSIEKMENSYLMARKAFENDDRILLNASINTNLSEDIIKKVDYYSLF